jgi:hypothetical protein
MASFIDQKVDTDQYMYQFFELEDEVESSVEKLNFEKLKKFKTILSSKGFSRIIENLRSDLRVFEPDPDLRAGFEISEKQLIGGVREVFLQLQKYS